MKEDLPPMMRRDIYRVMVDIPLFHRVHIPSIILIMFGEETPIVHIGCTELKDSHIGKRMIRSKCKSWNV